MNFLFWAGIVISALGGLFLQFGYNPSISVKVLGWIVVAIGIILFGYGLYLSI